MPSEDMSTKARSNKIEIRVSSDEKARIERAAEACNLTVSDYLRKVGTGYVPPSRVDQLAIVELSRLHADLGRLGGLFKLAMAQDASQRHHNARQPLTQLSADIRKDMDLLRRVVLALEAT